MGLAVVGVGVVATSVPADGVNCASFNKKFRFSDDSDETVNEIKYKHGIRRKEKEYTEKKYRSIAKGKRTVYGFQLNR